MTAVWKLNITGRGVVIAVVDDGKLWWVIVGPLQMDLLCLQCSICCCVVCHAMNTGSIAQYIPRRDPLATYVYPCTAISIQCPSTIPI